MTSKHKVDWDLAIPRLHIQPRRKRQPIPWDHSLIPACPSLPLHHGLLDGRRVIVHDSDSIRLLQDYGSYGTLSGPIPETGIGAGPSTSSYSGSTGQRRQGWMASREYRERLRWRKKFEADEGNEEGYTQKEEGYRTGLNELTSCNSNVTDDNDPSWQRDPLLVVPSEDIIDAGINEGSTSAPPVLISESDCFWTTDPFPVATALYLSVEEAFFLSYALGVLLVYSREEYFKKTDASSDGEGGEYGGCPLKILELWRIFCEGDPKFVSNYAVYHHFRCKSWVVRPGASFGTDWVLYEAGPQYTHSTFGVLVAEQDLNQVAAAAAPRTKIEEALQQRTEYQCVTNKGRDHDDDNDGGKNETDNTKDNYTSLNWTQLAATTRCLRNVSKVLLICSFSWQPEPTSLNNTDNKPDFSTPNVLRNLAIQHLSVKPWFPQKRSQ